MTEIIEDTGEAVAKSDRLRQLLEQAARRIECRPRMLSEQELTLDHGLNMNAINAAAELLELPQLIHHTRTNEERCLRFVDPDEIEDVRVTIWHRVIPVQITDGELKAIVAILRGWIRRATIKRTEASRHKQQQSASLGQATRFPSTHVPLAAETRSLLEYEAGSVLFNDWMGSRDYRRLIWNHADDDALPQGVLETVRFCFADLVKIFPNQEKRRRYLRTALLNAALRERKARLVERTPNLRGGPERHRDANVNFKCDGRTLIVPRNELPFSGSPISPVLQIEREWKVRLRDGGNPTRFLRIHNGWLEQRNAGRTNRDFRDYCGVHHSHIVEVRDVIQEPEGARSVDQTVVESLVEPRAAEQSIQVSVDDIDSFSKVKEVRSTDVRDFVKNGRLDFVESRVKEAICRILGIDDIPKDHGGELNDIYTANVQFQGRRVQSAFALKGRGVTAQPIHLTHWGQNGDQIQRLFMRNATLYVIQFVGEIGDDVVHEVLEKTTTKRRSGQEAFCCIINGQDTARLMLAYGHIE